MLRKSKSVRPLQSPTLSFIPNCPILLCCGGRLLRLKCGTDPARDTVLHFLPHAGEHRRVSRAAHEVSNDQVEVSHSALGELALVVTHSQEVCVDDRRKKRVLEGQRPEKHPSEDHDLGIRYDPHSRVVVG